MTLEYAADSGSDQEEDLGEITRLYSEAWGKFYQGDTTAACMSGHQLDVHECDLSQWLCCDWFGKPHHISTPFMSRVRVDALFRITRDARHDSLSNSMSPREASMILHRCAVLQCIGALAGSLRGLAYGVAFSVFGPRHQGISRILHAMHEHDSFCCVANYIENHQVPVGLNAKAGHFNSSSCGLTHWRFVSPAEQHLCALPSDSSDVKKLMADGSVIRPKKTEVRGIMQHLIPSTLCTFYSGTAINEAAKHVPTHEMKLRRAWKERQVVPAVSWAKLRALAPIWRREYGRALLRCAGPMACNFVEVVCAFRRKFIMRFVDAGFTATFAAKAFTAVMEHGLALKPVGAFVMSENVMPTTSLWHELADYRDTPTKSVFTYSPWLSEFKDRVSTVVQGVYTDEYHRWENLDAVQRALDFSDEEWIASGLPFFLPVPPAYLRRYSALLSNMDSHTVTKTGGE